MDFSLLAAPTSGIELAFNLIVIAAGCGVALVVEPFIVSFLFGTRVKN